jgi:hypothetical protein
MVFLHLSRDSVAYLKLETRICNVAFLNILCKKSASKKNELVKWDRINGIGAMQLFIALIAPFLFLLLRLVFFQVLLTGPFGLTVALLPPPPLGDAMAVVVGPCPAGQPQTVTKGLHTVVFFQIHIECCLL